jgi:hypothetical protein
MNVELAYFFALAYRGSGAKTPVSSGMNSPMSTSLGFAVATRTAFVEFSR